MAVVDYDFGAVFVVGSGSAFIITMRIWNLMQKILPRGWKSEPDSFWDSPGIPGMERRELPDSLRCICMSEFMFQKIMGMRL